MLLLSDMQRNILILTCTSFMIDIFKFMIHSFNALSSICKNLCSYSLIAYLNKSTENTLNYYILKHYRKNKV